MRSMRENIGCPIPAPPSFGVTPFHTYHPHNQIVKLAMIENRRGGRKEGSGLFRRQFVGVHAVKAAGTTNIERSEP
jgi:hypothetical protein